MDTGSTAPSLRDTPRTAAVPEPRHRPLDPAEFARAELAITALMDTFFTGYLVKMYRAFDGDIVAAIVLGEVAHHNVSAARNAAASPEELNGLLQRVGQPDGPALLPTNAFSIAQATGIPRETVRRKIRTLVDRGWMAQDRRGSLTVTPESRVALRDLSVAFADQVLALGEAMSRAAGRTGR